VGVEIGIPLAPLFFVATVAVAIGLAVLFLVNRRK
jgi:hypothetical protein